MPTESNPFWMQDSYSPQISAPAQASSAQPTSASSEDGMGAASQLGWLGGPKGAAAMAALQMISQAAERQRKERLMEYESRVQRLKSQQQAAAAGQQMAQALRF